MDRSDQAALLIDTRMRDAYVLPHHPPLTVSYSLLTLHYCIRTIGVSKMTTALALWCDMPQARKLSERVESASIVLYNASSKRKHPGGSLPMVKAAIGTTGKLLSRLPWEVREQTRSTV